MENPSRVFQKQKRKTIHGKIEYLLPFTGCRKLFGKMPEVDVIKEGGFWNPLTNYDH